MLNNSFFYFLTLSLLKEKKRFLAIFLISTILIFILSSSLFIASSIKHSLKSALKYQPDLIVQSLKMGKVYPFNEDIVDKVLDIYGVSEVTKRVYGRYFFNKNKSALIVGVDFLDEQSNKALKDLKINLKSFLSKPNMIIGKGVEDFLKKSYYNKSYTFLTPDGEFKKVAIFKVLSKKDALFSNDLIIMPIDLAREILGLKSGEITDIALNVPNKENIESIKLKLTELFYNTRIVDKKDMQRFYENIFNFKSGYFLMLFLITIITFTLLLYIRYSLASSVEKKEIAILRSVGWSIKDVLKLKFLENISIILLSFILGVGLAYIFVFIFAAPILKDIFLGSANLKNFGTFEPVLDFSILATIFIIFTISFLASVLIPVWKISVTEPKEALR